MYVYAIRVKDTHLYMPTHQPSKAGATYSSDGPKENGGGFGPRLFPSLQSARNSLTAWLQGIWGYTYNHDEWREVIELTTMHVPSRKRENMEIVRFDLVENCSFYKDKHGWVQKIGK